MKKILFFCFIVLGVFVWNGNHHAYADYNNLPTYLPEMVDPTDTGGQYINLVIGNNDPGTGYGANIPTSELVVYARDSGAQTVYFGVVNRRLGAPACFGYRIIWTATPIGGNGLQAGPAQSGSRMVNGCSLGPTPDIPGGNQAYRIDIPAGLLYLSDRLEDEGAYKAKLSLTIVSTDGGANHSATIRPNIDINRGRLGYAKGSYYTVYPSLNQAFNNTLSMRFRQPCNVAENGKILHWWDDDYVAPGGTTSQNGSPRARVYEYAIDSNGIPQRTGSNAGQRNTNYGNGGPGSTTVDVREGFSYELLMETVDGGNGIRFEQPYDSGDFYFKCKNFDITSLVSSSANPWVEIGSSVTFTHQINSSSSNNSNPTFTGRSANLNYNPDDNNAIAGGSYNSTNRPGSIPLGAWTVNDNERSTKTIPNNAGLLNQSYCQRYAVDPKTVVNGVPTSGIYVGEFACSNVVGGKTVPLPNRIGGGDDLAENEDSIQFSAGFNTTNYHTSGGWQGYSVECSWDITRTVPGGPEVSTGTTGSCNGTVTSATSQPNIARPTFVIPNTAQYPIGTKVCIRVTINHTRSISNGNTINDSFIGGSSSLSSCYTVSAKPFVRAYQSDVIAGGRFSETGLLGVGNITANLRDNDQTIAHAGSGVEFAAIAAGRIDGFASATTRSISGATPEAPLPKGGLALSNNDPADLGDYFDSNTHQVKDWFLDTMEDETRQNKTDVSSIPNLSSLSAGGQSYFHKSGGGVLSIDNGQNPKRHTVYVDGDVVINDDIKLNENNVVPGGDVKKIDIFTLVVKGNIYIAPNVRRLDGIFVAQPKDVSGGINNGTDTGIIYTCRKSDGTKFNPDELYNSCNSKLQVNGAFIAQKTKFLRTNGTLSKIGYTPETTNTTNYVANPFWVNGAATEAEAKTAAGKNGIATARCYKIQESINATSSRPWWGDNWICTDIDVRMEFHDGGLFNGGLSRTASNDPAPPGVPAITQADIDSGKCVSWGLKLTENGRSPSAYYSWDDNYLCTESANLITFETRSGGTGVIPSDPTKQCIQITEASDADWNTGTLRHYFCIKNPVSQTTVTVPRVYDQLLFGSGLNAEEFRLSPEFYMGNPSFKPRGDRSSANGEYDSIVSLPPIL